MATGERWGERVIDLDIIFFGDMVVNEDGLVIPHPHAHERAFVLAPLSDIAPDFVHPESGATVREMYIANGGDKGVLGKFCMGREPGHDDLSLTVQGVIAKL
jgi:2-amino-4-hydroxy-6-hydroxymethyldihydropteridine diphosphokinase